MEDVICLIGSKKRATGSATMLHVYCWADKISIKIKIKVIVTITLLLQDWTVLYNNATLQRNLQRVTPVSYTHLDVYKRQPKKSTARSNYVLLFY